MLGILLLSCQPKMVDSSVTVETDGQLSLLTYNVHGLPEGITGDDTSARMVQIAPLLNQFDLVGLQEDFMDDNHSTLEDQSTHDYHHRFSTPLEDRAYGSGLATFSNPTVLSAEGIYYSSCYGTFDGASDCLASKGFQWIRLQLGSAVLHVYNTHMEAGGGEEDEAARTANVNELVAHITENTGDEALIFMGDTNLHPDDPIDVPLIDTLMGSTSLVDSCEAVGCEELNHIDRILFRPSSTLLLTPLTWVNEPQFFDSDSVPLSDHPAISVSIEWSTN